MTLPLEILDQVYQTLYNEDILHFSLTCKEYRTLTQTLRGWNWYQRTSRDSVTKETIHLIGLKLSVQRATSIGDFNLVIYFLRLRGVIKFDHNTPLIEKDIIRRYDIIRSIAKIATRTGQLCLFQFVYPVCPDIATRAIKIEHTSLINFILEHDTTSFTRKRIIQNALNKNKLILLGKTNMDLNYIVKHIVKLFVPGTEKQIINFIASYSVKLNLPELQLRAIKKGKLPLVKYLRFCYRVPWPRIPLKWLYSQDENMILYLAKRYHILEE